MRVSRTTCLGPCSAGGSPALYASPAVLQGMEDTASATPACEQVSYEPPLLTFCTCSAASSGLAPRPRMGSLGSPFPLRQRQLERLGTAHEAPASYCCSRVTAGAACAGA